MHIDNELRIQLRLELDSIYLEFYLKHRFKQDFEQFTYYTET